MKKLVVLLALFSAAVMSHAQKPALDHSVYDDWKSLSQIQIPDGGDWAMYTVAPQQGDVVLHIYNVRTGKQYKIDRASAATISEDATKLVFRIAPLYEQTRQAKIKKKKADQMPKDTLGILDLVSGKIEKIAQLKSLKTPQVLRSYVAFQKTNKDNDTLYVLNIKTNKVDSIKHVEAYSFPEQGETLAYITKPGKKDSLTVRGLYVYYPSTATSIAVLTGEKKASFGTIIRQDKKGEKIVFFASLDTAKSASKKMDMYLYSNGQTTKVLAHDAKVLPKGWKIGENYLVTFHKNYFTFGTQPIPREKDTTLVEFEQAKLDIWVWNEDYIQPIQKVNLPFDKGRSYLAKINYDGSGFVQIADESVLPSLSIGEENEQDYILASGDKPYRVMKSWETNAIADIYKISLKDGSRQRIMEAAPLERMVASPDGAYYVAYNAKERNWYQYTLASGEMKNLTGNLGVNFWDEEDDHPMWPGAAGNLVWSEDSKFFLIRDAYDYWRFDPTGKEAPKMLTEGKGRLNDVTYTFVNPLNKRTDHPVMQRIRIRKDAPAYFTTLNHKTKERGVARKDITRRGAVMEKLVEGPNTYAALSVSSSPKQKAVIVYTKACFEKGTDLYITKDSFKSQTQLTDINPQMRKYNWGTVELVNWKSADGKFAEGLLFKPENFNPEKKYPVIIYFYERYSDDLYAARVPAPSASTVNIPYFVSNEYICFIPDIRYTDGHPGKSALNYIMPACDMLCQYPWIDGDNMAIQGQSWGGYQVAYMITQTGRFKAAGAGAPVSNMTSAYGGIRWESGRARTMQYERGQSRIGTDLWSGFDLYVENSPLFHVPNVTTPVLIMHNDADGAVPWWQGIEFFNGLRRCGKQAWLLQYNDEAHNLRERRNRKDLSRRLEQFFGHFLKGEPMPVWMSKGVPATVKGIEYGFETASEQ